MSDSEWVMVPREPTEEMLKCGVAWNRPTMREVWADMLAAANKPATLADGGPPCNQHPDAPHGFDRNGSHGNDRYTCDCEGWTPPDAAELILRDVCELDPADPEDGETVCVSATTLAEIVKRHTVRAE